MGVMTGLLLLLWAGVAVSTPVDLQKRVIGGRDCAPTERLYHVEVRGYRVFPGQAFSQCGGSLISNQWILTAAHCWDQTRAMKAVIGIHPGGQGTLQEITAHFHPDNHDIMLLRLNNPTEIKHVPLPVCGKPLKPGDTVEIAGLASTTMGLNNERRNDEPTVLQCANIKVQDCKELTECLKTDDPDFYTVVKDQHWQCYQSPGVDLSAGDSGGGVVFKGMIYGVHSFTGNETHACVEAAGFMDVCQYIGWIQSTIKPVPRPRSKSI